jgi:hypothetical protein
MAKIRNLRRKALSPAGLAICAAFGQLKRTI